MSEERIPDGSSRVHEGLAKGSQLSFGVYSWLHLVDLVSRHDTS